MFNGVFQYALPEGINAETLHIVKLCMQGLTLENWSMQFVLYIFLFLFLSGHLDKNMIIMPLRQCVRWSYFSLLRQSKM